jgi:hypothetical protein
MVMIFGNKFLVMYSTLRDGPIITTGRIEGTTSYGGTVSILLPSNPEINHRCVRMNSKEKTTFVCRL